MYLVFGIENQACEGKLRYTMLIRIKHQKAPVLTMLMAMSQSCADILKMPR